MMLTTTDGKEFHMSSLASINELQAGCSFQEKEFLIESVENNVTKTGSNYIRFSLTDRNGSLIRGNYWEHSLKQNSIDTFNNNKFACVITGKVDSFQNRKSINIQKIRSIRLCQVDDSSLSIDNLKENVESLKIELNSYLEKITDPDYHTIVSEFLKEYGIAFSKAPAATRNHHNYLGGLLFHTISILRTASNLIDMYELSPSLLYSGIILHDFGKVYELDYTNESSFTYTNTGKLLGHISICDGLITKICQNNNIDSESVRISVLRNAVLSHHGSKNCGSPVLPMTVEATVIHKLDGLDAAVMEIKKSLVNVSYGEFGNRVHALNDNSYFKHNIK